MPKRSPLSLALGAAALLLAAASRRPRRPRPRRRGDVDLHRLPLRALRQGVRLRPRPGLARPPPARLGALQQRRLRLLPVGRRPHHHQPARRPGLRPEAVERRARLPGRGLRRPLAGRGGALPRPRAERAGERGAGHRPGAGGGGRRRATPPRRRRRPARRDVADREGVRGQDRPALRPGDPLRRRRVRPLPLPALHRRPHGVLPRAPARQLRRRPGQLRLPALRHRFRALPGVGERRPGADPRAPRLQPGRGARRAT